MPPPHLYETPAPPLSPVLCAWNVMRRPTQGWRPRGTRDWMLFCTMEGAGRFGCAGGTEFFAEPGSLVLIERGAPHDYEVAPGCETWTHWWVHFLPLEPWAEWMDWPRAGKGHRLLPDIPADLLEVVKTEMRLVQSACRHRDSAASLRLSVNALERVFLLCATKLGLSGPLHDSRVQKARSCIAEHLGEKLTIPLIAKAAGLSRSRLSALFEAEIGQPVMAYVEELRLQRARELLERSSLGVGEIADSTGFASPFYFSTRFKRRFGQAPGMYRKALWHPSG